MRGFSQVAALVLAPTAVLALSAVPEESSDYSIQIAPDENPLAVGVEVWTNEADADSLFLHIEIGQVGEACDPAKVRVEGYLLSQDDTGAGQGTFASTDGSIVTANWTFNCRENDDVSWDQDLVMNVMSMNDQPVLGETKLSVSFKQTTHPRVVQVSGENYLIWLPDQIEHDKKNADEILLLNELLSSNELPDLSDELRADILEMKAIRKQIDHLEELMGSKQWEFISKIGPVINSAKCSSALCSLSDYETECDSPRCIFTKMTSKVQHAHEHFCDSLSQGWKTFFGCPDNEAIEADWPGEEEGEIIIEGDYQAVEEDYSMEDLFPETYYFNFPLLMLVAQTAITFGFIFYGILRCARRRVERRNLSIGSRIGQRCRTWAERRARHKARREAVRSFIRGMFRKNTAEKEEKEQESFMSSSTMEEEIAGFRGAVDMVDDLIAVEEGRMSRLKPAGFIDDEVPPAYESEVEDVYPSMVSNGSRYTPPPPPKTEKDDEK
ncbi:hypothetical protein PT974_00626 [Cladobotryum mycophilum]|uniref:Uncharacterized protein n=1 Tax=Cladobotryum mycophilum TaxID=491253 RepID=A0ABR0T290_9HYPO